MMTARSGKQIQNNRKSAGCAILKHPFRPKGVYRVLWAKTNVY